MRRDTTHDEWEPPVGDRCGCAQASGGTVRPNRAGRLLLAGVAVAALVVETGAFWLWRASVEGDAPGFVDALGLVGVSGLIWTLGALVLHFLQGGLFWATAQSTRATTRGTFMLAAWLAWFLPGVGAAGVLAAALASLCMRPLGLAREFERNAGSASVMEGFEIESHLEAIGGLEAYLQDELSTRPVLDIARGDDVQLKRGAVKLLRERGGPEAARLIHRFLQDPDAEVRLYAHTALARLQEELVRTLEAAEEAARRGGPDEAAALARLYCGCAEGCLADDALTGHYLQRACEAWERAHALNPGDPAVALQLGETLLQAKRHDEALPLLEAATQEPALALEARLALCRLHYERRDYDALAAQARAMRSVSACAFASVDPTMEALRRFWAAPQAVGLRVDAREECKGDEKQRRIAI